MSGNAFLSNYPGEGSPASGLSLFGAPSVVWGKTGGSETPPSRTFYSRFPPLSVGVPTSLLYFYCEMLRNIVKFFSFFPGSRHFGNLTSRPLSSRLLSSRLPYPSRLGTRVTPGFIPYMGHAREEVWYSDWTKGNATVNRRMERSTCRVFCLFEDFVIQILLCEYPYLPHGSFFHLNPPTPLEFPV